MFLLNLVFVINAYSGLCDTYVRTTQLTASLVGVFTQENLDSFTSTIIKRAISDEPYLPTRVYYAYEDILKLGPFVSNSVFNMSGRVFDMNDFVNSLALFEMSIYRNKDALARIITNMENGKFAELSKQYKEDFLEPYRQALETPDKRYLSLRIDTGGKNFYPMDESITYLYLVWNKIVLPMSKNDGNFFKILSLVATHLNYLAVRYDNLGQLGYDRSSHVGIPRTGDSYTVANDRYFPYSQKFVDKEALYKELLFADGTVSSVISVRYNKKHPANKLTEFKTRLEEQIADVFESLNIPRNKSLHFKLYTKTTKLNGKTYPMTTTVLFDKPIDNEQTRMIWLHTPVRYIDPVLEHVKLLYNSFPIANTKAQYQQLARIHYFMAETMPFSRGSALVADILTKIIMLKHNMDIYTWKQFVFPDLEAFVSPSVDEYSKNYTRLFGDKIDFKDE